MTDRITCSNCGNEHDRDALSCPHCGRAVGHDFLRDDVSVAPLERDRNLLFCVLAIQLRIITAKDFVQAAAAWSIDPSNPISDWLLKAGAISPEKQRLLEGLVDEATRHHAGRESDILDTFGGREFLASCFPEADESSQERLTMTRLGLPLDVDSANLDSLSAVQETPGRYTQMSEYSRGGMGRILLVHDAFLSRDVALKELLPLSAGRDDTTRDKDSPVRQAGHVMTRFLREARVTGQLEHPAIVPVYELGRRDDGTLYYTMKLVRGKTLARALSDAETLGDRLRLLRHFIDLCQALAYAHSRNVIHRDIKPTNIMIGEFGETVVIDWGLAKIVGKDDLYADELEDSVRFFDDDERVEAARTKEGAFMGTPEYMSPEQAAGQIGEIDERSDIFSLGVVLYEILSGKTPFHAENVSKIVNRIKFDLPTPMEDIEPDCPPELRSICLRAIEKDRKKRYQSAMELAEELERFQSGAFVKAYGYNLRETLSRYYRRYRDAANVAIVASLGLLVVAVFSYTRILNQKNLAEQSAYASSTKLAYQYLDDREFDAAFETLEDAPEHLRGWEWKWAAQSARPWINSIEDTRTFSWTSDGRYVITSGLDNRVTVRNAESLDVLRVIETEFDRVRKPVLSPDSSRMAVISDKPYAEIYDTETGTRIIKLESGLPGVLHEAHFSESGSRLLVRSSEGRSAVIEVESGEVSATFGDPDFIVDWAAFDRTTTRILLNSKEGQSRIYSAETGVLETSFSSPLIAINIDDDTAYLRNRGDVEVWSLDTNVRLDTWSVFRTNIALAIVNESDSLLGLCDDTGRVVVMDRKTGSTLFQQNTGSPIRSLHFSPDGEYIAVVPRGNSRPFDSHVWHVASGVRTQMLRGHSMESFEVAFSPTSSRIASTSYESVARIWEGPESRSLFALASLSRPEAQYSFEQPSSINTFSTSRDGSVVLLGFDRAVYEVINGNNGERVVTLTGDPSNMADYGALSGDGRTAVFLADQFSPAVFDTQSLTLKRLYTGHDSAIVAMDAAKDADRIVSASTDGFVKLWSAGEDQTLAEHQVEAGMITAIAMSRSGTSVCIGLQDGTLTHWEPEQGRSRSVQGPIERVSKLAFSPGDAELLALYGDGTLAVWRLNETQPSSVEILRSENISDFALSDDRLIYTNLAGSLALQSWPGSDVYLSTEKANRVSVAESALRLYFVNIDGGARQLYRASVDTRSEDAPIRRGIAPDAPVVPAVSILGTGELELAVRQALRSEASVIEIAGAHPFIRLGLYGSDTIIAVNGNTIADDQELRQVLTDALNAGGIDTLTMTVRRANARYRYSWLHFAIQEKIRNVSISAEQRDRLIERARRQLRENPEQLAEAQDPWYGSRGLDWRDDGLIHGFVVPGRFFDEVVDVADAIGLSPRDVVETIQGQPVDSLETLDTLLSGLDDSTVNMEIRRGSFQRISLEVNVSN